MSDTFCPIPWIMLAIRTNGDVRVCCQTNQGPTQGILNDGERQPYNLGKNKISESKNAELACDVRLSMLKGERHAECIRCWREEDSGMISRRQQEADMWKEVFTFNDAEKITEEQGRIPDSFEPVYYDLRLGNHCNLRCRMCYPTDSAGWYREYTDIFQADSFPDTHGIVKLVKKPGGDWQAEKRDYDWCLRESFWQDLESKIKHLRHIYIVGGEPLLIERHYQFLEKCINQGQAKKIRLEYNTNITAISDRVLDLWQHFKQVRIGASIDALGELNDYIRYPSKWNQVEKKFTKTG